MADLSFAAHGGWPVVLGTLMEGEDLDGDRRPRGDGRDPRRRRQPGPDRRLRRGPADEGRDGRRAGGHGRRHARRPRRGSRSTPTGPVIDVVGHGRRPCAHDQRQHPRRRSSWPAPAGRCASTATGPPRPRAAPPTCWRPSASRSSSGRVGVAACVREARMGFCFAPRYHPAMRHAGPSRRDLGIPTAFNILGPLSNPGRVRRYLIGVADLRMAERMAGVLQAKGARAGADRPWRRRSRRAHDHRPLHGRGAARRCRLDVGASSRPTSVWRCVDREDLVGGDAAVNADLARPGAGRRAGPAPRHRQPQRRRRAPGGRPRRRPAGRHRRAAREAIDSGAAVAALAALVEVSQREATAEAA